MKANTKKDYWEDEIESREEVIYSAMELADLIEEKVENAPGKGKLHVIWKKETNKMIETYNNSFGHIYKKV